VPVAGYLWNKLASAPARAIRIECPFRNNTDVKNRENRIVATSPSFIGSASARRKLSAGPSGSYKLLGSTSFDR
jgi:hypothetical protein